MNSDWPFQLAVLVLLGATLAIRIPFHARAGTFRRRGEMREGMRKEGAFRWIRPLGLLLLLMIPLYVAAPGALSWAQLSLSETMRWVGAPIGALSVALLLWVHRTLDRNFSGTLTLQPNHELVVAGPYRWVRHPMYVSFLLLMVALFLLTANVLMGVLGFAVIGSVIVLRTGREEAQLAERFGAEYERYRSRTGALLPKWR
jgi:protein-S-isoprenylcysteine O-methyltransferase Ste14